MPSGSTNPESSGIVGPLQIGQILCFQNIDNSLKTCHCHSSSTSITHIVVFYTSFVEPATAENTSDPVIRYCCFAIAFATPGTFIFIPSFRSIAFIFKRNIFCPSISRILLFSFVFSGHSEITHFFQNFCAEQVVQFPPKKIGPSNPKLRGRWTTLKIILHIDVCRN